MDLPPPVNMSHRQRRNYTRPYRSKRHPPCDQCRRRKLRCQADGENSCERCQAVGGFCSFGVHRNTQSTRVIPSSQEMPPESLQDPASLTTLQAHTSPRHSNPPISIEPFLAPHPLETTEDEIIPPAPAYRLPERPTTQAIQSLDALKGFSSQLIGASGESDPWLLRHGKFDDHGYMLCHQVHFRNAGGVPLDEKIPVHFLVSADQLYEQTKKSTGVPKTGCIRDEINTLVPLDCGQRLVALFVKFVFPALPIISRSQFGLSTSQTLPGQHILQQIPVHLLAAIYASAQPFVKFDEYLCVINAYSTPPTERLWRIVFEIILEEIHTPHLAVLQAGLLYLHQSLQGTQSAVADSSFVWSFVGLLVGLATSLGLHLECQPMGFPAWERRLRRRLWWATYAEDKWRGLLMGRPSYIRDDEWDVTGLVNDDFQLPGAQIDPSPPDESQRDILQAQRFQFFIQLTCIADEVQHKLFSLRASQRLSSNFPDSLNAAHPLLQKLKEWYTHLPTSLRLQNRLFTTIDGTGPHSNCLHFAYILLEVFIFRSLLRPMVRSATPPRLFEETEVHASFTDLVDDYISQIIESDEVEPVPAIDMSNENGSGSAVLKAAENCASKMLRLVMRIPCSDLAGFWYSWSRVGFATVSNFMLLLLIQAPSKDHAIRARRLVYMWRQALRSQSKGYELMNLALVRLDGPHWTGLSQNYYLPKHVKEALDSTVNQ